MGDILYLTIDFSIKLVIISFLLHMMIPIILCGIGFAFLTSVILIAFTTIMGA